MKQVFDRFRKLARECGPVTVYAQKTRIVFQVRVRFGGAVTRKRWLEIGLWLTERAQHQHLRRVEQIVPNCFVHYFRFKDPAELDDEFVTLLQAAYAIGGQEHLHQS